MSKILESCEKHIYNFPYDLVKRHTFEKPLSFRIIYSHVNVSAPSSHLDTVPLIPRTVSPRLPWVEVGHLARKPPPIFSREKRTHRPRQKAWPLPAPPPPQRLSPSGTQNSHGNSLWFLKWHKDQEKSTCALVCKEAAATFSNSD